MDKNEKRIWQYLDGELSTKQSKALEQRLASDAVFMTQYEAINELHSQLKKAPMESAPRDMMQLIMDDVAKEKIYIARQTSFIDLKYILGIFGGLNFLLLAYQLMNGSGGMVNGSSLAEYIGKYSSPLQGFATRMPEVPSNLVPYGLALGLMLVLFWADQLANKVRPSKRRI